MLSTAKRLLIRTAKAGGLFRISEASGWRNRSLLILCYHGIATVDEHLWNPGLYIDLKTFRSRMQMLCDGNYRVLPLGEGLKRVEDGTLPPRSVAITFDDGSYDMYALARPVLLEFGFPATVYLTTYYCEYQVPVFDPICAYLLWKGRGRALDLQDILPEGGSVILDGEESWREPFGRIYACVREQKLSGSDKDGLAELLATRLGIDYEDIRRRRLLHVMNPEEAAAMAREGFAIELHTHRHRTPRDADLFAREIRDNARVIQEITSSKEPPSHFCYPSGQYFPEFFGWLRDLHVQSATTCDAGLVERGANVMRLPRLLDMPTLPDVAIEGWLSGFTPWMRQIAGRRNEAENPYSQPHGL